MFKPKGAWAVGEKFVNPINYFALGAVTTALALASPEAPGRDRSITDPRHISSVIHAIPATGGDLGSRLAYAGLTVISIQIGQVSIADVNEDPETWAMGDTVIQILTEGEASAGGCQILGSPMFIKRRGRYIPHDRTGVWLTTGRCALPD